MLLLSTSDGKRGGRNVLKMAYSRISRGITHKIPIFSLPFFYENFKTNVGIIDVDSNLEFKKSLNLFQENLDLYGIVLSIWKTRLVETLIMEKY